MESKFSCLETAEHHKLSAMRIF